MMSIDLKQMPQTNHLNPSAETQTILTGLVTRRLRGEYAIQIENRIVACALSNKLHKKLIYPTGAPTSLSHRVVAVNEIETVDPIAIGDTVTIIDAGDGTGLTTGVLPRKSQLSRKDPGLVPLEQVMVANADQALAVFAATHPTPKWGLLDRYLVSAEAANLPALIVITKMDLLDGKELAELSIYQNLGYQVVYTSASSGLGIEIFKGMIKDRVSILMGKSGVGKTSLLNAIQPDLGLRVNAVGKETGKGRHTTTHLELFPLAMGGGIIDTPGMRTISLWDIQPDEIAGYFPEMRPYLGTCRFGMSCHHASEPGCAILRAVKAGAITEMRYQSYLKLALE
jgi:ribosome biogenesis GTPase